MARTSTAGRVLLAVVVATAVFAGGGVAASSTAQDCSFPFSKVDATGTEVTLKEEPETVVTLNPSAAQTMWEIGAKEKVVGVTKFATYLDGADEKTNISGAGRTTVITEKVIALEPDLVLVPNAFNDEEKVEQLRDAGLTAYRFERGKSLDDVAEKTRLTGQLVGECEAAERSADRTEAEIDTVREAVESEERPKVLYVLGPSGYVAGEGTFIHTAIEAAGGENIAAEANISWYQKISPEVVAEEDPEWIIKPTGVPLPDSDAYEETTAMQEDNVIEVDRNYINQPAPRIVRPIRTMAKVFHPEAYAEANATETPTPSPTDVHTPTPTPETTDEATPTPATGPGFGVAAALVALLATLALMRRR